MKITREGAAEALSWLLGFLVVSLVIAMVGGFFYALYDQEVNRQEPLACEVDRLYDKCIAGVPKGPQTTVYNDWAEVVEQCRSHAREVAPRVHKSKRYDACEVKP